MVGCSVKSSRSSAVKKKISPYYSTTSRDKHNFKINVLIYFSPMFHFLFAEELRKPTTSCTSTKMPSNTFRASDICKIFCSLQVLESLWITHLCIYPAGAGALWVIRQDDSLSSYQLHIVNTHFHACTSSEKLKTKASTEESHTQAPQAFLSNRLEMSDENMNWTFLRSTETNLGWNSSWELRNKKNPNPLICLCYGAAFCYMSHTWC